MYLIWWDRATKEKFVLQNKLNFYNTFNLNIEQVL
jgi:hypothetical protein